MPRTAHFCKLRGIKRPELKAEHSRPCSEEVKNQWSYIFTPPYVFVAWCLIQSARDNFTFNFTCLLHQPCVDFAGYETGNNISPTRNKEPV
jgi:hypothetical protein